MFTHSRTMAAFDRTDRPRTARPFAVAARTATLSVALTLTAAQVQAQRSLASGIAASARDSTLAATPKDEAAAPSPEGTISEGFKEGHLYVGPRVWAGVYGTMAFGVSAEKSLGGPRKDLGNGRIGVGGGVDMYSYSAGYAGYRWSYRVIPVSGFANYHMTLRNPRLDPYAGLGLGYYIVSSSVDGPGLDHYDVSARANALFIGAHLGARYFVKPNLAVQAETGVGLGSLAVGVTWKR